MLPNASALFFVFARASTTGHGGHGGVKIDALEAGSDERERVIEWGRPCQNRGGHNKTRNGFGLHHRVPMKKGTFRPTREWKP
jgi:hypothetical protein